MPAALLPHDSPSTGDISPSTELLFLNYAGRHFSTLATVLAIASRANIGDIVQLVPNISILSLTSVGGFP